MERRYYFVLMISVIYNVYAQQILDCEELSSNCYGCTSSPLNCVYITNNSQCVSSDLYNDTSIANFTKLVNSSECACSNSGRDINCSFCIARLDCTYCQDYRCYSAHEPPDTMICFQKCIGTKGFVTAPYVLIAIYTGLTLVLPTTYLVIWWIWMSTGSKVPIFLRWLE